MISVAEAFDKFKSRLEPSESEDEDARRRQADVRETIRDGFSLDRDFLTGSYRRWTKIKPLRDIDLFCVLNSEKEGHYLEKSSRVLLDDFAKTLSERFGMSNLEVGDKSVTVCFDQGGSDEDQKVLSIDVVPAFEDGKAYKIPDRYHPEGWMKTDPEIHAELATQANKALDGKWVTLVKMIKKSNEHLKRPVCPSFLLEVMALKLICPPFAGGYKYEVKSFVASARREVLNSWPDPAGYGPPVSDAMTTDQRASASRIFEETSRFIDQAILCENQGRVGEALAIWQKNVFGSRFPQS